MIARETTFIDNSDHVGIRFDRKTCQYTLGVYEDKTTMTTSISINSDQLARMVYILETALGLPNTEGIVIKEIKDA